MNKEQEKQVIDALVDFVLRVSKENSLISDSEIAVLPEVASLLFAYSQEEKMQNILGEEITLRIDGEELFKAVQQANEAYKRRHGQVSPLTTVKQALTETLSEETNTPILPNEIHKIVFDFDKNDFCINEMNIGKDCMGLKISAEPPYWDIRVSLGFCGEEREEEARYTRTAGLPGIRKVKKESQESED